MSPPVPWVFFAQARRYDAWNGRFVSKDSDKFIKITRPESFNQYMYCYASPLKYVDPSGNDSYIITINPPNDTDINWDENAEAMKRQIEERYEGEIVHIIYISNEDELIDAWNSMGGDSIRVGAEAEYEGIKDKNNNIVVINTHGDNKGLYFESGGDCSNISHIKDKMKEQKVNGVILGGCNTGLLNNADNNVAANIARLINSEFVISCDGSVQINSNGDDIAFGTNDIWDGEWQTQARHFTKNLDELRKYGWLVYQYIDGEIKVKTIEIKDNKVELKETGDSYGLFHISFEDMLKIIDTKE